MNIKINIQRNGIVESTHPVIALMMDYKGNVIEKYFSNQQEEGFEVFPRSAIKFAQAISFVQSEAIQKFSLDDRHIAISCASHSAEKFHTDLVTEWLHQMKQSGSLECGPHYPGDEKSYHELVKQGLKPTAIHNNCSGKHAGMIATCLAMGMEVKNYTHYDHPLQKRLRKILTAISDFDFDKAQYGIDGCSIPTYPVTLKVLARTMTALLPQRNDHDFVKTSAQIVQAIQKYPEYIAGTNGYCTKVIQTTGGRILAKTGAEGVYAALHLEKGLVLVLKAKDGQTRASRAALLGLLEKNNWINREEFKALKKIGLPAVKNWSGDVVGETVFEELS